VLVPADASLGELHEVIIADPSDEEHERILEWPGLENPSNFSRSCDLTKLPMSTCCVWQ
jgi:hypothetical protein